jgi:uncharacterized repeat protein (TIGR03803 family)
MTGLRSLGASLFLIVLATVCVPPAFSAKYKTLYQFTGKQDGNSPQSALIIDKSGNLYGTTLSGGQFSMGTIFEVSRNGDGTWKETVLHSFEPGLDGYQPYGGLVFDDAGNMYGTTFAGGANAGTVFELSQNGDGTWTHRVIYSFHGGNVDGAHPYAGVTFDAVGNLYGTTSGGGSYGYGTVFQLTPNQDGSWTENVIHSFDKEDGATPYAGVVFDAKGNLYGTAQSGGSQNSGTLFELSPQPDGTWAASILHQFCSKFNGGACYDGDRPMSTPVLDDAGNLYGTTHWGGIYYGMVYQLKRDKSGHWIDNTLHTFSCTGIDGYDPVGGVIFDNAGNLYGTTVVGSDCGGNEGYGTLFRLNLKDFWRETLLVLGDNPGAYPMGNLVIDAKGNLFGTTAGDGTNTHGTVFAIVP